MPTTSQARAENMVSMVFVLVAVEISHISFSFCRVSQAVLTAEDDVSMYEPEVDRDSNPSFFSMFVTLLVLLESLTGLATSRSHLL